MKARVRSSSSAAAVGTYREAVLLPDPVHRLPASLGGYKFPEATTASTCFSKDRYATKRRSRAFSRPRSFIFLA
jgi:hypothetical protein